MRILLVSNYQPPHMGGIEYAVQSLKNCWQRDGHEVTWLTTDLPRGGRSSTPDNIRVPAWNILESRWQINSPLPCPAAWPVLRHEIARADVINPHSLAPGLAALALHLALRRHRPVVATQHVGIINFKNPLLDMAQKQFICRMARWGIHHGMILTFVGLAVKDWFLEHARLPPDRVAWTPVGVDQQDFHFVDDGERRHYREKWGCGGPGLNVLFVGRFYEKKGLPLLRDVATQCPGIRFTLLGGGPLDPAGWGLPNIRIIAHVSTAELRELYGAHDLFIMPSYGEGWPAVVCQAMACGLPCLVSEEAFSGHRRDAGRFLVCRREAAVITPLLQAAAAGQVPLLAQRQATAAYAAVEWDWMRTARTYAKLFEQAMRERQGISAR